MADALRCPRCRTEILEIIERRKVVQIDTAAIDVFVPLAFHVDDALRGYTRAGNPISGRVPRDGEQPNAKLHRRHQCGE